MNKVVGIVYGDFVPDIRDQMMELFGVPMYQKTTTVGQGIKVVLYSTLPVSAAVVGKVNAALENEAWKAEGDWDNSSVLTRCQEELDDCLRNLY